MSMRALEDLREMLCDELDEIAKKQEMSAGDLETIHKLTDTIKNIDKIIIMDEDGGYSRAGDWEMEGRDYSERRRDSMGRYSRDGAKEHMMTQLEEMERNASNDKERDAIRRCINQLEST